MAFQAIAELIAFRSMRPCWGTAELRGEPHSRCNVACGS